MQILPPKEWQEFEKLCKKLWGEIFNCNSIKSNGSRGHEQKGVDIWGFISAERLYFGIQCKHKDIIKNNKLTEKSINDEINKALTFQPELNYYIIATSSSRDVKIDEYIRIKSLELINNGKFEIQIYFWEDIVELIEEHKDTYNWYVNKLNFKNSYKVNFTFDNNENIITLKPKFIKETINYIYKEEQPINNSFSNIHDMLFPDIIQVKASNLRLNNYISGYQTEINHSRVDFKFKLQNNGNISITNYKIYFDVRGNFKEVGRYNLPFSQFVHGKKQYCVKKQTEKDSFVIEPFDDTIVPSDKVIFDEMYLYTYPTEELVEITWELVSSEFKVNGKLEIKINPEIIENENVITVYKKSLERTEVTINEYIEDLTK